MRSKRAKPTEQPKPPCPRVVLRHIAYVPKTFSVPVDIEFIAVHLPKFHVKDLVVIAAALGAQVRMAGRGTLGMVMVFRFDDEALDPRWHDTEVKRA